MIARSVIINQEDALHGKTHDRQRGYQPITAFYFFIHPKKRIAEKKKIRNQKQQIKSDTQHPNNNISCPRISISNNGHKALDYRPQTEIRRDHKQ